LKCLGGEAGLRGWLGGLCSELVTGGSFIDCDVWVAYEDMGKEVSIDRVLIHLLDRNCSAREARMRSNTFAEGA
jgi:hypothetical protein